MNFTERVSREDNPIKISFCTTVKGVERLAQLKETLPHNLAAATKPSDWPDNKPWPDVEFVILAYGDPDVASYVKTNYANEIKTGRIVLAYTDAEKYHYTHSKNMAHRIASGDVLCNLDVDNYLGEHTAESPSFVEYLSDFFLEHPSKAILRVLEPEYGYAPIRGMGKRIAISKKDFYDLRGYAETEEYSGWNGNDREFMLRALSHGFNLSPLSDMSIAGNVIDHSDLERSINTYYPEESLKRAQTSTQLWEQNKGKPNEVLLMEIRHPPSTIITANESEVFGCGTIAKAFYDERTNTVKEQTIKLKPFLPYMSFPEAQSSARTI